jgi:hypothetical protein
MIKIDYSHMTRCMKCDTEMSLEHDFRDAISNYAFVFCHYCLNVGPSSQHRRAEEAIVEATHLWNIYNMCLWASEYTNQGER